MSEFYEMIRHTRNHQDRLKKFCAPLFRNLGFNCIFYHYISPTGHGTCFGTDVASFEYYFFNHLYRFNPYARHPDHFQNGVHLIPEIKDQDYQKTIQFEGNEFDIAYKVVILEKTADGGCQGFSFAMSNKDQNFSSLNFVNDIPLLQCFIRRFKEEMGDFIQTVLEDQESLADAMGADFYTKPDILFPTTPNEKKIKFLQQIGVLNAFDDIQLSTRETQCIRLLLQGYTAGQIADFHGLSKRTVEHYLENIKLKVNCDTKVELVEKFQEINALGLL